MLWTCLIFKIQRVSRQLCYCINKKYLLFGNWMIIKILSDMRVGIINHCLGLGHETMVCAVCLTMFLWSSSSTEVDGIFPVVMIPLYTLISNGLNMHGNMTSYWPRIVNHRILQRIGDYNDCFIKIPPTPIYHTVIHDKRFCTIWQRQNRAKWPHVPRLINTHMVLVITIITRTRHGPFQSVGVIRWISNFILHFTGHVIT